MILSVKCHPTLLLWPLRASSSHYTNLSSRCGEARLLATPQHAQAPIFMVSHPEILSSAPNSYTYTLTHHIISACQLIKRTIKCHCWEQWHKQQSLSYIYISSPDTLVLSYPRSHISTTMMSSAVASNSPLTFILWQLSSQFLSQRRPLSNFLKWKLFLHISHLGLCAALSIS